MPCSPGSSPGKEIPWDAQVSPGLRGGNLSTELLGRDPALSMEPLKAPFIPWPSRSHPEAPRVSKKPSRGRLSWLGTSRKHQAALDTSLPTASGKAGAGIFPPVAGEQESPWTGSSPLTSRVCLSLLTELGQLRIWWNLLQDSRTVPIPAPNVQQFRFYTSKNPSETSARLGILSFLALPSIRLQI